MTHKELVKRAKGWLSSNQRAAIIITELHTRTTETPDAIGFIGEGGSVLIECKASRADFLADAQKCFRREPERGMGDARYFMAPPGIIREDDDMHGWGVLEVTEHRVKMVRDSIRFTANKNAEIVMLMSALRRLEISTAVFVIADLPEQPQQSKTETE